MAIFRNISILYFLFQICLSQFPSPCSYPPLDTIQNTSQGGENSPRCPARTTRCPGRRTRCGDSTLTTRNIPPTLQRGPFSQESTSSSSSSKSMMTSVVREPFVRLYKINWNFLLWVIFWYHCLSMKSTNQDNTKIISILFSGNQEVVSWMMKIRALLDGTSTFMQALWVWILMGRNEGARCNTSRAPWVWIQWSTFQL